MGRAGAHIDDIGPQARGESNFKVSAKADAKALMDRASWSAALPEALADGRSAQPAVLNFCVALPTNG